MLKNMLVYAVLAYAVVALILFTFQRKLLYFPSKFMPTKQQLTEQRLHYWPTRDNYRGFSDENGVRDARGTIIVFHGNAGTAFHRDFYIDALSMQGFRVILAEYPGYGDRLGTPTENVLVSDGLETLRLAHEQYGEPLFLWGESLGSGVVASMVSKTDTPLKGLVLMLPWDSLSNLAQSRYWFLPTRWLLRDQYNSVDNLNDFEGKVAVLVAENDEVIPVQHGKKLFDSINADKQLWSFAGARHNSLPIEADRPWWGEVCDFITQ